jgi:hypothetical protein
LRTALEKHRIKLLCVPYWWNQSLETLRATVHKEMSSSLYYEGQAEAIANTRATEPEHVEDRQPISISTQKDESHPINHPMAIRCDNLENPQNW